MSGVKKVDIRPGVSVLAVLRHLNPLAVHEVHERRRYSEDNHKLR